MSDNSRYRTERKKAGSKSTRIKVFTRKMKGKLAWLVVVIMAALVGLGGVLLKIEKTHGREYEQIVMAQQNYSSKTLPYKRGEITDRNGNTLATSVKVYNVVVDAFVINSKEEYLEPTIQAIDECFDQVNAEEIRALIASDPEGRYLKHNQLRQLTYEQIKPMAEILNDKKTNPYVKGVWFEEEYKRMYPYGSLASATIGFSPTGSEGGTGIEKYYNDYLSGTDGRKYGHVNDDNTMEDVVKEATDGYNLVSTIDINLQKICEKYIAQWVAEYHPERVAVVIANPNTGEILAMADDKSIFDLNDKTNLDAYYTQEEQAQMGYTVLMNTKIFENDEDDTRKNATIDALANTLTQVSREDVEQIFADYPRNTDISDERLIHLSEDDVKALNTVLGNPTTNPNVKGITVVDERKRACDRMWRNYCVSDSFEAGSTIKPFTIAGALEDGKITQNMTFLCDGFEVYDKTIHCHKRSGHGTLNVEQAIMNSCNDCLMQISRLEGVDTFCKYQSIFGFGMRSGIDLPGEASCEGLLFSPDAMTLQDLATNSFGQNFNVNAMQMVAGFSALINGGNYYKPHVIKQVLNSKGGIIENYDKQLIKQIVTKDTSDFLRQALYNTVAGGTGKTAAVAGYQVGGKTGTAQHHDKSDNSYLLSFLGFAPYDNPQLVCYAIVDAPQVPDTGSSSYACRLFSAVMTEALPYWNVFPTVPVEDGSGNAGGAQSADTPQNTDGAQNADGTQNTDGAQNADGSQNNDGTQNTDGSQNNDGTQNADGSQNNDDAQNTDDDQGTNEPSTDDGGQNTDGSQGIVGEPTAADNPQGYYPSDDENYQPDEPPIDDDVSGSGNNDNAYNDNDDGDGE